MRWLAESLSRAPAAVLVAVLAVLVVGSGLFGFAIAELTSDSGGGSAATTTGGAPAAATTTAPEAPAVVGGSKQDERDATADKQRPHPRERGVPGWPKGVTAHTVILVTSSDRRAALNVAKEARSKGLEAGLMPSDPYDLGTGLWIVYSGRFTTAEGAQRQASQLARRYPGAYPQLIQSSQ
jgi:hypothetical protein